MEKLRPKVTLREVVELTQTSSSEVSELNCWLSGTSPLGRALEASCPAEGQARQPGWAARAAGADEKGSVSSQGSWCLCVLGEPLGPRVDGWTEWVSPRGP